MILQHFKDFLNIVQMDLIAVLPQDIIINKVFPLLKLEENVRRITSRNEGASESAEQPLHKQNHSRICNIQ